jgi:hypothetical protein
MKDVKDKLERGRLKYFKAMKSTEEALSLFDQMISKEYPEEKKAKINAQINLGLKTSKEEERNYKSQLFYCKEFRQDYITRLVKASKPHNKPEFRQTSSQTTKQWSVSA